MRSSDRFTTKDHVLETTGTRQPRFSNVELALRKLVPDRPTLFELLLNDGLFADLLDEDCPYDFGAYTRFLTKGFRAAGYDYVSLPCPPQIGFPRAAQGAIESISLNEGAVITDVKSLKSYIWPDCLDFDYSYLTKENLELPDGMKVIIRSDGGLLENLIALIGYDRLCLMIYDSPGFVSEVADRIGKCLLDYYSCCLEYDTVGACFLNDDWGYKTQTMISPKHLREYVFPWHKKINELIHKHGKYSILHSCGYLTEVLDDVISDMKFDAKHSFEDSIIPVEEAYEIYKDRIAVAGGIDIDFMCRKEPEEIYVRAVRMLERSRESGGYLLGTGNSIPDYIPRANVYALWSAAFENGF